MRLPYYFPASNLLEQQSVGLIRGHASQSFLDGRSLVVLELFSMSLERMFPC